MTRWVLKLLIVAIYCVSPGILTAQQFGFPSSFGGGYAMGHIQSVLIGHDALFNNQAGLVHIKRSIVGVNALNRYLIEDLNQGSIALGYKLNGESVLTARIDYLRHFDLILQQYSAGIGRKLFDKTSLGLNLKYQYISLAEYGTSGAINADLNVQFKPLQKLLIGFSATNILSLQNNETTQVNPFLELGGAYEISDKVLFYLALSHEINFDNTFHFGFSYAVAEALNLKAGYFTNPGGFTFGISYNVNQIFRAELATARHNHLGMSPSAMLMYGFGKEK